MEESGIDISKLLDIAYQGDNETRVDLKGLYEKKLAEHDLTSRQIQNLLKIERKTLVQILDGTAKQPNLINVLKIADFLEIDIKDVLSSILANQSSENVRSLENAKSGSFIAKNFDVDRLFNAGFIQKKDDPVVIKNRILTFFGYESIGEYQRRLATPLFSKSKRKFNDKMRDFWIKSAYQCFLDIQNPFEYDRSKLIELIPKIKPYSQDVENGLLTVCKALYNIGVTVIIQNQLTTTQVRGGTFVVNGKPCIVLTDLFKNYTTIWFALLHELHHVLYDLEVIEKMNFHLTGDPDLFLIEEKANEFAQEYFFGKENFLYVRPHVKNHFVVDKLAKKLEVHPSLVYAGFQFFEQEIYGNNYYAYFKKYFPNYELAIKGLSPITWKENSLAEIAEQVKTIFEINKSIINER